MGLVNTSYSRALVEIVALLHDPNPHVRKGAIRAIAFTQPLAAEAVLRSKAIQGDAEPDVTGEALSALLKIAPNDSMAFVAGFLDSPEDPVLRQAVACALGASKLEESLEILRSCWNNEPYKREQDHALLLGAVLHRSEDAFAWLLDVIVEEDRASARFVVEELSIYRSDKKLRKRVKAALARRNDDALVGLFDEIWC
jgi:HEAT repeat protein